MQAMGCPHCAHVCFPAPGDDVLDDYYQNIYPAFSVDWYNLTSDYAPWKAPVRAKRIANIAKRYGLGAGTEVHEFGCAFGGTVQALNDLGYSATGTELNEKAVSEARAHGNDRIFAEDAVSFIQGAAIKPQIIYSYHAIEHFTDPYGFLMGLRDAMARDGIIILVAPSSAAKFALVYGLMRYDWFGYPEHLHLFSPGSAPGLGQRIGMDLLEVSSQEFGMKPEFTDIALEQASPAAYALRAGNPALMGEEVTMVFARSDSDISKRYASNIEAAGLLCESFALLEKAAMEANRYSLIDPASLLHQQERVAGLE